MMNLVKSKKRILLFIFIILIVAFIAIKSINVFIYYNNELEIHANIIQAGSRSSFFIDKYNNLWVWGQDLTDWERSNLYTPQIIMDNVSSVSSAAGSHYVLVIRNDSSLWGWGQNFEGAPGNITRIPSQIIDNIAYTSARSFTATAITKNGRLISWGLWGRYEVNDILNGPKSRIVTQAIANSEAGLAIDHDGRVFFWSPSGFFTSSRITFGNLLMEDIKQLSFDNVLKNNNTLWNWEVNHLNSRTTSEDITFSKVMEDVRYFSSGGAPTIYRFTMAIKNDNTLWAWGSNNLGQLGDGTTEDREEPVFIMDNVAYVSTGTAHTLALTYDGKLWAWGSNSHGQLGDGTTEDRHSPIMPSINMSDIGNWGVYGWYVLQELSRIYWEYV